MYSVGDCCVLFGVGVGVGVDHSVELVIDVILVCESCLTIR